MTPKEARSQLIENALRFLTDSGLYLDDAARGRIKAMLKHVVLSDVPLLMTALDLEREIREQAVTVYQYNPKTGDHEWMGQTDEERWVTPWREVQQ